MTALAPLTRVVRHHSDLCQWEMVSREPDPRLRAYVHSYLGSVESTPGFMRRMETPSSVVVLIIGLGSKLRVIDPRDVVESTAQYAIFVAGLHDSYVLTESRGMWQGIQVNFTPIGAHLFLGLPMHTLTNRVVELDDIFGAKAHRLVAQLHEASSWEARFAILDAAIIARLAEASTPSLSVAGAWQRLNETGGHLNIGTLAAELGCSQKHLIAQFREQIGLPPKVVARIMRFNRVVSLLKHDDGVRWAKIALDCGYYDQAHFIRDFREFAGSTPSEFLGRRLPDGGGFRGD